jgi:hypothetical protein
MENLTSQLISAISELTGRNRQEVITVFKSCLRPDPDRPDGPLWVELNDVEKALGMEPGFFRRAAGRA